ncbi:sialic acid-binding Ig-like lectin 9 isoform X2 [Pyxicephalus adspersus]|uniref:sialic acid-binding Ig-like lectin 9 isoform X2 n=1 Tax=Pyxicephalus adspersus TaxID=30357 RepID=UPI003B5B5375
MWHERTVLWMQLVAIMFFLHQEGGADDCSGHSSINLESEVTVNEGQNVTIRCNFSANECTTFVYPTGIWRNSTESNVAFSDKSRNGTKPNFQFVGNLDSGDCSLIIINARREDAGLYHFKCEDETSENNCSLNRKTVNVTVTAHQKMIIGIACGIIFFLIIIMATILLFKFRLLKQTTSTSDTNRQARMPSSQDVPPEDISQLYAKVQKPKSQANPPV